MVNTTFYRKSLIFTILSTTNVTKNASFDKQKLIYPEWSGAEGC